MESPYPPAACAQQLPSGRGAQPVPPPPDPHTHDFVGEKMGKLFPTPLGFAVVWFCGKCVGRAGQRWGAKRQRSGFQQNVSWESTGFEETFAASLSATFQPEVKGESLK